jgi:hypothetical protein
VSAHRADALRQMAEARNYWLDQVRLRAWYEANMRRHNLPGDTWELLNVIRPREAEAKRIYRDAIGAVCTAVRTA